MLDKPKDPDGIPLADSPEVTRPSSAIKPSMILRLFKGVVQLVLMAAILGGSIFAMMRLVDSKPEPRVRQAFKTVYTIKTVEAVKAVHQPTFISYGQIAAARNVDLRSLVSGEVVSVSDKLQAGSRVEKGEALVEIDRFVYLGARREALANLKEARARLDENKARIVSENSKLASAEEQLAIAVRDNDRAKSLRKNGTMTQQQVEVRTLIVSQRQQSLNLSKNMVKIEQARLGQQEAVIERLEWRLAQAERNLENTVLKAPFAGIVRSSSVNVGKLVSANDVVVSLFEPGKLEAKFTLTNAQFGRLQSDEDGLIDRKVAIVWAIGGQEINYTAAIARIGAEINSSRGGVEVFARLANTGNLAEIRPGAFVEIEVLDKIYTNTVQLPDLALYNGAFVYVKKDGVLSKRAVTIAAYDGENILVSKGLANGERVLITRIAEVSDGLAVREENEKAKTTEGEKTSNAGSTTGRPAPEELKAILVANRLSSDEWGELKPAERRQIIKTFRTTNGS